MITELCQNYIQAARRFRQSIRIGDILILEDDPTIGQLLARVCDSLQLKSIVFNTLWQTKERLLLSPQTVKYAIVDYQIDMDLSDDVLVMCERLYIPYMIYTGYSHLIERLHKQYPNASILIKNNSLDSLIKELTNEYP